MKMHTPVWYTNPNALATIADAGPEIAEMTVAQYRWRNLSRWCGGYSNCAHSLLERFLRQLRHLLLAKVSEARRQEKHILESLDYFGETEDNRGAVSQVFSDFGNYSN